MTNRAVENVFPPGMNDVAFCNGSNIWLNGSNSAHTLATSNGNSAWTGTVNIFPSGDLVTATGSQFGALIMNATGSNASRAQLCFSDYRVVTASGEDDWDSVHWRADYVVDGTAQCGIAWGVTSSVGNIEINGYLMPRTDNALDIGTDGRRWRNIQITGDVLDTSDRRLKKDLVTMNGTSAIDFLTLLTPVTGRWKAPRKDLQQDGSILETEDTRKHNWFIAQNVRDALRATTGVAGGVLRDDGAYLALSYKEFTPILTSALKTALTKIAELESRISVLESK